MKILILIPLLLISFLSFAVKIHVGQGQPYITVQAAANNASPGDSIIVHDGIYIGGEYISDLQGTESDWIYIINEENTTPVYQGGKQAWHLTNCAFVHISGIQFEQQTLNSVNVDDGGDYSTPAHHIIFENCTFKDMNATGNNDLLKLSGLNDFEVRNCVFANGSAGGSGIDMVGCHNGLFRNNSFDNMGSNAIQAKGGTQFIEIRNNFFNNCGQRTLNLGGNTGLEFFRPMNATFEASDLQVYSNVFIGSVAPIAYVGSQNVAVVNNTIYKPEKWVVRILQETVDSDRFVECGSNSFINNIVYIDNNVTTEVNIGSNTRSETFIFLNNLWFKEGEINWSGPDIPVFDSNIIVNLDPLFVAPQANYFALQSNSSAIGKGMPVSAPQKDYLGFDFNDPPSIGAYEGSLPSNIMEGFTSLFIYPNPSNGKFYIILNNQLMEENCNMQIFDISGKLVHVSTLSSKKAMLDLTDLPAGVYTLNIRDQKKVYHHKIIINNDYP